MRRCTRPSRVPERQETSAWQTQQTSRAPSPHARTGESVLEGLGKLASMLWPSGSSTKAPPDGKKRAGSFLGRKLLGAGRLLATGRHDEDVEDRHRHDRSRPPRLIRGSRTLMLQDDAYRRRLGEFRWARRVYWSALVGTLAVAVITRLALGNGEVSTFFLCALPGDSFGGFGLMMFFYGDCPSCTKSFYLEPSRGWAHRGGPLDFLQMLLRTQCPHCGEVP